MTTEIPFIEVNGTKYISSFPRHWITNMCDETGPDLCPNCRVYGSIKNIFVTFCANCAIYVYEEERGLGTEVECTEELAHIIHNIYINTFDADDGETDTEIDEEEIKN